MIDESVRRCIYLLIISAIFFMGFFVMSYVNALEVRVAQLEYEIINMEILNEITNDKFDKFINGGN